MKRFEALDGVRGIAAAVVLIYHIGVVTGHFRIVPYGYLSVDLFFILSGFVIGSAYEPRLRAGLAAWRYILDVRIVRMYPMALLGILVGLSSAYIGVEYPINPLWALSKELFFIPTYSNYALYALDPVIWSLMFELIANSVHAIFFKQMSDKVVSAIVGAGALAVIAVAFHYYNLLLGANAATAIGGLARVTFSFFGGILLFRLYSTGRFPKLSPGIVATGFAILIAAVVAIMAVPLPSIRHHFPVVHDLFAVLIIFPLTVAFGASVRMPAIASKVADHLGRFSYPLYAIHWPLLRIIALWLPRTQHPSEAYWAAWAAVAVGLISLAWVIDNTVERPFQRWWKGKRRKFIQPDGPQRSARAA